MHLTYINPKGEHHAVENIKCDRGQVVELTVLMQNPEGGLMRKSMYIDPTSPGAIMVSDVFHVGKVAKFKPPEPPPISRVVRRHTAVETRRVIRR